MSIKRTLSGKEVFFSLAGMALFIWFMAEGGFNWSSKTAISMDKNTAHYEAEKLLAVIDGKPKTAAFLDPVLQNDQSYQKYFTPLHQAISSAPINEPAFLPYKSCIDAGNALEKFAELRKKGGGQNDLSDRYRRPFWDNLDACKKSVETVI